MMSIAQSEALLDAMVNLVHNEPSSLSVFTSGSAFIHGISGDHIKRDDEPSAALRPAAGDAAHHESEALHGEHHDLADRQPGARKLDRSAAELLRPMLRQWLSDNMPRIVEEALRRELMNSQDGRRDSDEV
jgi:cell pole-organizing protein PopZ